MILPLLIIFLVLVCAYLEYQKNINLHNKLFVLVICVLTFTICFSFIKKYDTTYESFEDKSSNNSESFEDKSSNNSESFEDKSSNNSELLNIIEMPKKTIFINSKPYGKYSKKEKFKSRNNNPELDELVKSQLREKYSKRKVKLIPRLKKNIKSNNNQNKNDKKKKQVKEQFSSKNHFYVKDNPACFKLEEYTNKDYGPSKSQIEEFYDKPLKKGYSQIDNKHWRFPHRRPPSCLPDRVKLPSSVIMNGVGTNVLELDKNGDIAGTEEFVSQTNVGSILPKFEYKESYD